MRQFILLLSFSLLTVSCTSQPAPARLIVRGDDMGFSHSGNLALIKSYKEGIERSIEVIVPSPWFPEAVKLLADNPGVDVGVHLAITSEWENIKWRPLTHCPSITDSNGYFYPMISANPHYPGQAVTQHSYKADEVEKEFRAQIEMAKRLIPRVSHISAHMGCTNISPEISSLAKKLAIEYDIDIDLADYKVSYAGYEGAHTTTEEKKKSFVAMLDKLEPGKTYLFLDHPGFDSEELRAIHHIGYENVAQDRQGVTDLFTDREIAELIRKKKIELISYKDLKKNK